MFAAGLAFRPLLAVDLPLLREWLARPHVSRWWGPARSQPEVDADYAPAALEATGTRCYIALRQGEPLGFIQVYSVAGAGGGWWQDETDPGARGIDQFLCNAEDLGQGWGSTMVRAFVDGLLRDPAVSKVQADPAPDNERAIRSLRRAGFQDQREVRTPDGTALLMVRRRDALGSTGEA